jgi:hypothetical protein
MSSVRRAVKMEKDKLIEHEKGERICDVIINYHEPERRLRRNSRSLLCTVFAKINKIKAIKHSKNNIPPVRF